MSENDRVQVAIRVRPRLDKFGEKFSAKCCSKAESEGNAILNMAHPTDESFRHRPQVFQFNLVFDEDDTQSDIYEQAITPLVDSGLMGNPSTILAYGQTGSGKTHTIIGDVDEKHGRVIKDSGIFPRVIADLFEFKSRSPNHVVITLSMLEIYNETIRDLLGNGKKINLRILPNDDVVPVGLTHAKCDTLTEAMSYFRDATSKRTVAATQMNDLSSRSHACFLIHIFQQTHTDLNPNPPDPLVLMNREWGTKSDDDTGDAVESNGETPTDMFMESRFPIVRSCLSLVDLAGSERLKRSQAGGTELKETQAINTSLSHLGIVVNGLHRGDKYINFRDSKLTLLLKSSFTNPSSRILLITNLSPTEESFQESLTSVRFADRVQGIKADQITQHTHNVNEEFEYLQLLKDLSLLCSDIRIVSATEGYTPQIRQHREEARKNGKAWNLNIKDMANELARLEKERKEEKYRMMVNRYSNRRNVSETMDHRKLKEEALTLELDEMELSIDALKLDIEEYENTVLHLKEAHAQIKAIRKTADRDMNDLLDQKQHLEQAGHTLYRGFECIHKECEELKLVIKEMEQGDEESNNNTLQDVSNIKDISNIIVQDVTSETREKSKRTPQSMPNGCVQSLISNDKEHTNNSSNCVSNESSASGEPSNEIDNASYNISSPTKSIPTTKSDSTHNISTTLSPEKPVNLPTAVIRFENEKIELVHFDTKAIELEWQRANGKVQVRPTSQKPIVIEGLAAAQSPKPTTHEIIHHNPYDEQPKSDADVHTYIGHLAAVYCANVSSDGQLVASASRDKTIKIWEVSSGNVVHTLIGHTAPVLSCCFSPIDNTLFSASDDRTLKKWDSKTGKKLLTLRGHDDTIYCCAYSPSGMEVASASGDTTVRVWQNAKKAITLKRHTSAVFSVAFSNDGKKVVSASNDKTLRIWLWAERQELFTFQGHTATVWSCAFHPIDDRILLSASMDGTIKVWRREEGSGLNVKTLRGHSGPAYHATFTPDGRRIASCSADRTIKIWSSETGEEYTTLQGHTNTVYHCCVHKNHLFSCSGDILKLWDLSAIEKYRC